MATLKSHARVIGLKATQLKALAIATGLPTTGTKAILIARLLDALSPHVPHHVETPKRILSIDMGIRNLAYCQIALPVKRPSSRIIRSPKKVALPIVEAWDRIAITSRRADTNTVEAIKKEAFDPITFAPLAFSLIKSLVLNATPTPPEIVLIERQRFRSMGGSNVQEWTLRVNMFEAMLYAVLETLQVQGLWTGRVEAMEPQRIMKFWISDEQIKRTIEEVAEKQGGGKDAVTASSPAVKGRKKSTKSKQGKDNKIQLVKQWLLQGNIVQLGHQPMEMERLYLMTLQDTRNKKSQQTALDGAHRLHKLDDLADCLLQGMAWVKWEENKRLIAKEGMDALSESD
ncbi:hypothetical protein MMC19_006616 [Ptychographa xylographoides]|nr:hypothetical protein [Ptychographa xylographoides]